jgi:hypothetical protein
MRLHRSVLFIAVLCSLIGNGCHDAGANASRAHHVMRVQGFDFPESVRYDAQQDLYFVSNMLGYGSAKDGQGYIARVSAADPRRSDVFIQGGVNNVHLDAPKGMAIQGDTLWVADIHVVRGFDRRTGAPVANIDMLPYDPVLLNDIALGPDNALYVTDTGIIMSRVGVAYEKGSQIFRITPGRSVSVYAKSEVLSHPNGITWDSAGKRMLVVTFHPAQSELYSIGPNNQKQTILSGLGRFDGVESLQDGRVLLTSWSDSTLQIVRNGKAERLVNDLWQPADLGVDTRRNRVAIPLALQGRVEIWQLPAR